MLRLLSLRFKRNFLFLAIVFMFLWSFRLFTDVIEYGISGSSIFILILLVLINLATNRVKVLNSGIKGEKQAYTHLKALKKQGYKIIKNVIIPKSEQGFRELDFIVIGPKGVFVIESKNISGYINGPVNARSLDRLKKSKSGHDYRDEIDNPVYQVSGQVYVLSQFLKNNNINYWVDYIVMFTNEQVQLNITGDTGKVIKVTNRKGIIDYINELSVRKILTEEEIEKVFFAIKNIDIDYLKLLKAEILNINNIKIKFRSFNFKSMFKEINNPIKLVTKFILDILYTPIVIIRYLLTLVNKAKRVLFNIVWIYALYSMISYSEIVVEEIAAIIIMFAFTFAIIEISERILRLVSKVVEALYKVSKIRPNKFSLILNNKIYRLHRTNQTYKHNHNMDNFNRQIMEEEFNRQLREEGWKSVTSFDEGGYLQGPGFNPSDTAAHDMNNMH